METLSPSAMTDVQEERDALVKLASIREIRDKTVEVEKLRSGITGELDTIEREDQCIQEYRREMELLQQERLAHVEELRQIHADISTMEAVMKQADEAKRENVERLRQCVHQFWPAKSEADEMRDKTLGFESLPGLDESELERCRRAGLHDKSLQSSTSRPSASTTAAAAAATNRVLAAVNMSPLSSVLQMTSDAWLAARSGGDGHSTITAPANNVAENRQRHVDEQQQQQHQLAKSPKSPASSAVVGGAGQFAKSHEMLRSVISAQQSSANTIVPASFRQQPPPMKSCLSCHQQIHRNAPICPLCKAKSRSRNPKKPKRKDLSML